MCNVIIVHVYYINVIFPVPYVQPIPGCPPGLEYMTMVDQLIVQQQIELLEGELTSIGLVIIN